MKTFDVVIPVAPKDYEVVELCVEGVTAYCSGAQNIYVVSKDRLDIKNTTWIDEALFPFNKEDIKEQNGAIDIDRTGWYLQQLINFYSFTVIPSIGDTILILDSDVIFLNDTKFFEDDRPCYMLTTNVWGAYYEHMLRLDPEFERVVTQGSANSHHGIWERHIVSDLMSRVESNHSDAFWKIMVKNVTNTFAGCADYEIYLNYLSKFYPGYPLIRPLHWTNDGKLSMLSRYKDQGFNFVACQAYNEWSRDI
jgi:hypothetical protein